jgi:serine/threonine protein phosphatase 1
METAMRVGEARVPDGLRLYAIGDVHGCDDALAAVHAAIATDLVWRPVADHRIIHVGDYTDRGPDSAGVVERLVELTARDTRVLCLRGNHDQKLLDFLAHPAEAAPAFFSFGGKATLKSYDVNARGQNYDGLGRQLAEKIPAAHRAFLAQLPYSVRFGDYFFCHAGIRPDVPLEAQTPDDLMWIRDGFLGDASDFGVVVVHGHTVTETLKPEIKPNRVDIDTGAVFGGPLTCLVLEGTEMRFL